MILVISKLNLWSSLGPLVAKHPHVAGKKTIKTKITSQISFTRTEPPCDSKGKSKHKKWNFFEMNRILLQDHDSLSFFLFFKTIKTPEVHIKRYFLQSMVQNSQQMIKRGSP